MSRPRFSEALVMRRHDLGLSLEQASRILKLRRDVLVAFEEGDYDHMPQSGYAQGMLSSYARYLGLNAREIVDLFQEELYEHRHGSSSHELRRRTRQTQAGRNISGYDVVNEAGSRPKAYVEYRPLLPTSGGPAGDMGNFATTAPARPRSALPLAGVGTPAPGTRAAYPSPSYEGWDLGPERRPYNSGSARERAGASSARRRAQRPRRGSDARQGRMLGDGTGSPYDERSSARLYRRDDVSTRRVSPSEYTDDMRYDDHASPYAPASTISGRRSSRNIAQIERPNVRRRPSSPHRSSARQGRGGRRPPARGGALGWLQWFFSDARRALLAIVVALTVVLTAIVVLSVSSCVSGPSRSVGQTVAVNSTSPTETGAGGQQSDAATQDADETPEESDEGQAADDQSDQAADGDGGAASDASPDDQAASDEPKKTVVEVSIASGEYSWLEIVCDGTSVVADDLTGPWSQTFTVYDSISISAGDRSAVTVTENGERVEFSKTASGLGSVTIKGTPRQEPADDASGASSDGSSGAAPAEGAAPEADQSGQDQ